MKILFVIKAMGLPGGGAERVVSQIAPELAARGHDVTVLTRDPASTPDFYPMRGVRRIRHGGGGTERRSRFGELARWMKNLRRDLTAARPDVVIGVMHSSYLPVGAALVGSGIPVIASEHTVYAHYSGRPKERFLLQLAPYLSAKITVVSRSALNSFPPRLRRRMAVLPNPVVGAPADPDQMKRAPIILSVGRLDEGKDHATLIDAFAALAAPNPDWRLEIAGDGPLRSLLEQRIARHDLGERIRLLGPVSDVGPLYRRASIFAMASRYESFGLAMAEALAHGLPVIGFADCPGINELIEDKRNGLLLKGLGDRTSLLTQALASLMKNEQLRLELGQSAGGSVRKYALEPTADRWVDLLNEIVAGPQPGGKIVA